MHIQLKKWIKSVFCLIGHITKPYFGKEEYLELSTISR